MISVAVVVAILCLCAAPAVRYHWKMRWKRAIPFWRKVTQDVLDRGGPSGTGEGCIHVDGQYEIGIDWAMGPDQAVMVVYEKQDDGSYTSIHHEVLCRRTPSPSDS